MSYFTPQGEAASTGGASQVDLARRAAQQQCATQGGTWTYIPEKESYWCAGTPTPTASIAGPPPAPVAAPDPVLVLATTGPLPIAPAPVEPMPVTTSPLAVPPVPTPLPVLVMTASGPVPVIPVAPAPKKVNPLLLFGVAALAILVLRKS